MGFRRRRADGDAAVAHPRDYAEKLHRFAPVSYTHLALPAGCVGVFVGLGSAFLLVSGLVAMTAVNRTYDPVIEIAPAAILTCLLYTSRCV